MERVATDERLSEITTLWTMLLRPTTFRTTALDPHGAHCWNVTVVPLTAIYWEQSTIRRRRKNWHRSWLYGFCGAIFIGPIRIEDASATISRPL